jgi:hypothetical protein
MKIGEIQFFKPQIVEPKVHDARPLVRTLYIYDPMPWDGIHQIVIRTLSGFRYLCRQLAYLVLSIAILVVSYRKRKSRQSRK